MAGTTKVGTVELTADKVTQELTSDTVRLRKIGKDGPTLGIQQLVLTGDMLRKVQPGDVVTIELSVHTPAPTAKAEAKKG